MPLFKSIDLTSPSPIGSTTPNTGAFTTLSANNGTITTSSPAFTLAQTWNAAGTTFTSLRVNITDTASNASSLLMDLQVGGSSRFGFNKSGLMFISDSYCGSSQYADVKIGGGSGGIFLYVANGGNLRVRGNGYLGFSSNTGDATGSADVILYRDASAILAQRNSTNAQTFRIYNTFTDASNYERGFMRWATNVLEIGTDAAGTGTQRQLRFPLGTVTASTPLSITQTWNSAGVTFTGLQLNATDTASASASLLMDLQVGGVSKFQVRKDGRVTITEGFYCASNSTLDGIITRQAAIYGGGDANGTLILQNSNFNNFNMLKIGGTSTSFPALKRSSAILQVRLADDSGYTVLDAQLRAQGTAPATAGATGTAGDIRYDADYIYICTAANTWKRVAIATWP